MFDMAEERESAKTKRRMSGGFTLIELLVAIFVISTVISGLFGMLMLSLRTAQESERRVVAVALASERMEMVRNLPYIEVGTVGGVPAGSLEPEEEIERNGVMYTVNTNIVYIDDPFNEDESEDTDYKQVRVEVSWPSRGSPMPVLLVTKVAPASIEGGEPSGTLALEVIDAGGSPVAGADVGLVNTSVIPPINISTQTNNEGRLVLPGLPESVSGYELSVSKEGFSAMQTYDVTADFFPNADHSHLTVLVGELTEKTVVIDDVSTLDIKFQLEVDNGEGEIIWEEVPDLSYNLRGSKSIGSDSEGDPVYKINIDGTSNNEGEAVHDDLEWDDYHISIDEEATGYDIKETSLVLPLALDPGQIKEVTVILVPYTPVSLHISVVSLGDPIDGAFVSLALEGEYDEILVTGEYGQVLFSDLPQNDSEYELKIEADGFLDEEILVTVQDSFRDIIELIPEE